MIEKAIQYAERGWHVLPVVPKDKAPFTKFARQGYKSATTDIELIQYWWNQVPNLNVGIACDISGLVVLDVDFRNGGSTEYLADTLKVKTGDGFHYYYTTDGSHDLPRYEGIDVKYRGYVVAAGSTHPSGAIYTELGGQLQPIQSMLAVA